MPVSNLQIIPPNVQRAHIPFTVRGTFDFLPPGGFMFSVQDSGATTAPAYTVILASTIKPYAFSFVHPGLAAGTYTLTVGAEGSTEVATATIQVVTWRRHQSGGGSTPSPGSAS